MAFAGLWEGFKWPAGTIIRTFTIVTTTTSLDVAELRDRMPVIVEPVDWPTWLGETDAELAGLPLGAPRSWPVSKRVNPPH